MGNGTPMTMREVSMASFVEHKGQFKINPHSSIRCHRHRHRRIFDAARGTRTTTWACTVYPSSAMFSASSRRSASSCSPPSATTNNEALAFRYRGTQHCDHNSCRDTVGKTSRHYFRPGDANPCVGYYDREADPRITTRL